MNYCEEIKRALEEERAAQERIIAWRDEAADAFAALNGWKHSERPFELTQLARASTGQCGEVSISAEHGRLIDHPIYYRESASPYRPVAVIGQPYSTEPEAARAGAERLGLVVHVPPDLTASWWYPGWTRFYCYTRPGTVVRFLPDQCGAILLPEEPQLEGLRP